MLKKIITSISAAAHWLFCRRIGHGPPLNDKSEKHRDRVHACNCVERNESTDSNASMRIRRVYIAPGCMICNACVNQCPEVFELRDTKPTDGSPWTAIVKPDADAHYILYRDAIESAAMGCCVDVIKIEYESADV